MLASSRGRLICLSTPFGKRGFFYDCWVKGGADWHRIEIPATQVPRFRADFLAKERRALGESWYRQEYCCSFEALEGLVYPDFARCLAPSMPDHLLTPNGSPSPLVPQFGGIDFGFRNPFAAIWGILDRDGILWLTGEHYSREKPLSFHASHLPPGVSWYADPSGASDIAQLCSAGFKVRAGDNDIRPGIAAVRSRLENGTLRVLEGACPNLLAEAALYRYGPATDNARSENPVDEYNHALGALRYLISKLDARLMSRLRGKPPIAELPDHPAPSVPRRPGEHWLKRWSNEDLWSPLT
jgi:hypothetical protein